MSEPQRITDLGELIDDMRDRWHMVRRDALRLGIKIVQTETRRTSERQEWLYASGRTRPGPILTNLRGSDPSARHVAEPGQAEAVDYYAIWMHLPDLSVWDRQQPWSIVGSLWVALGCVWGGAWRKPWDLGHSQWR